MSRPEQQPLDILIIGGGPIGLACALEARRRDYSYVVIEKGCLANSIYHYPTAMRFFSTPELLELADVPFITQSEKPTRMEALEYYRRIKQGFDLNVRLYEKVLDAQEGPDEQDPDRPFKIQTTQRTYQARYIIAAVGFFDRPRTLDVPGEDLEKVTHYYQEAHRYADQDLLIIGSGNSAVEAALECYRHNARVTMAVRGADFHDGIKYWVRPDIENRIKHGEIKAYFKTRALEIRPRSVRLQSEEGASFEIPNDFVLALTGYQPDFAFLQRIGVEIQNDRYRTPTHDPDTYETNRPGLYLAGVVVGGMRTNKWFIENSRDHAQAIFDHIALQPVSSHAP